MTSSFNPLQVPDYEAQFDNIVRQQEEAMASVFGQADQDDQVSVNYASAQTAERERVLDSLASFSGTLMDSLIEQKKKDNEAEMQAGIVDAFYSDDDDTGIALTTFAEQELVDSTSVINKTADKIEASDGHSIVADQVRRAGSWREYGRYVGQIQNNVNMLPTMMSFAQKNMSVTIKDSDGSTRILAYSDLKEPEDFQLWMDKFTKRYLSQFPGLNPQVAQKYVFPQLRQNLQMSAIEWNTEREKINKQERKDDALDRIRASAGTPFFGEVYKRELDSRNITRLEGKTLLEKLAREKVITQADVNNMRLTPITDRADGESKPIGKVFARDFDGLGQIFEDQAQADYEAREALIQRNATAFERQVQELARGRAEAGNPITQGELNAAIAELPTDPDDPNFIDFDIAQRIVKNIETQEDLDDDNARTYLNALRASRGYITAPDVAMFSGTIQGEFGPQVSADAGVAKEGDGYFRDADEIIEETLKEQYYNEDGKVKPNMKLVELASRRQRAQAALRKKFNDLTKSGAYTPADALQLAKQDVLNQIGVRTYTVPLPVPQGDPDRANAVRQARNTLAANPDAYKTSLLPNSEPYLEELREFKRTGQGQMPEYYKALAIGSKLSAWDYADAQLKVAGDTEGLMKPAAEEVVDNLSPDIQKLLREYNTGSRSFRAAANATSQGGDVRWFLDTIAGRESSGYGEYDAYNLGGADDGYTAYGSGNSAEDGRYGAPISTLSLGTLMQLGSERKIFAAGRYQFIPDTLRETFNRLKAQGVVDETTIFDAQTQDRFAIERAKQRISWPGQNSVQGLINEWRGLKFEDPVKLQRMLNIIRSEPYLQPNVLMPGVTN
jgi:hypothetical protein